MKQSKSPLTGQILASAIYAFDYMVMVIAMPKITQELHGDDWYTVGFGIFILLTLAGVVWGGQITDKKGAHISFYRGFAIFFVGLIVGALAPNIFVFILARALQGFGGGMAFTTVNALTNLAYDSAQRPKIIAILNTSWIVPALLAPGLGGLLLDTIGWRYIFWVQLPFVALTLHLLLPIIKQYVPVNKQSINALWPSFQLVLGATLILFSLNEPSLSWELLLLPLGCIITYVPLKCLLPDGIFSAKSGLPAGLVCFALVVFIFHISEIFIPLLLTQHYQISSSAAGLALSASAISWPLGAMVQARLSRTFSHGFSLKLGFFSVMVLLFLMVLQSYLSWPYYFIYFLWGLTGFWLGLLKSTCRRYAMEHTPKGEEGATASSKGLLDALSGGLAAGMGGMIYTLSKQDLPLSETVSYVWVLSALVSMLGFTLAILRVKKERFGA